jgi:hypothetical protein
MLPFDADKTLRNARLASTEDLLDRVTAFRDAMEPEAVEIVEMELRRRGVGPDQIEQTRQDRAGKLIRDRSNLPARCSFCSRPAVERRWGWHRLWGRLPVFPRRFTYCVEHRRSGTGAASN